MKKLMMISIVPLVMALAGCSTAAERMAKCESEGVSKDTCYAVEQNRQASMNAVAEKQALENAAQYAQAAKAEHVADPLRMTEFTGPGVKASINNGFTQGTINNKKATVKRFNENYYELSGAGYVVSISLNAEGVESASYTKAHSRVNGIVQFVQK
ncbi:hypothetical protein QNN88_03370 [Citrobacter sp. ANG330]|uniref:Lipoprotein n=1 Tax=Citrobacter amalonaticus TaxID=35703 RepID=A0A9C7QM22_CITAM|nr:hypothetical protein [Citrobacter amalonaticus]HCD1254760.1 hypothetical protein [Citrobacter amalonaticus]